MVESGGEQVQALEIATINDFVRVLDEHPQWLEAVRERLLPRAVLDLPRQIADFAAATDRRFEAVEGLLKAQGRQLEDHGRQLEDHGRQLEDHGRQLEDHGRQLNQLRTEVEARGRQLEDHGSQLNQLRTDLEAHGRQLDQLRTDVAPIKAAHVINAARRLAYRIAEVQGLEFVGIVEPQDLGAMVRSSDTHDISDGDLDSFRDADLVLRATGPDKSACYVAVEVSYTVNGRDTRRAIRNAQFLTRFTGCRAYAVVAGLRRDDRIGDAVESGTVAWFKLRSRVLEVD